MEPPRWVQVYAKVGWTIIALMIVAHLILKVCGQ